MKIQRLIASLVMLAVAGCPTRLDLRAEPLPLRSPDPLAQGAYDEARLSAESGEHALARQRFAEFRARFGGDPLAPLAVLREARAALSLGDSRAAASLCEPLAAQPDAIGERARLLLGFALARSADPAAAARARELLTPFERSLAKGDELTELHAALAAAATRLDEVAAALDHYDRFLDGALPAERLLARTRAGQLVATLSPARATAIFDAAPAEGLARALLAAPVALARRAAGDEAGARAAEAAGRAAQQRLGLELAGDAAINSFALGLALPLSGKSRALGERALRGALLAAEALPAGAASLELRVRDTESSPERAAAAADELFAEGLLAVIGSPDRLEAQAQIARAQAAHGLLLSLATDDAPGADQVLRLLRPNASRAEALAEHALAVGATRVALLFPDNPYGRKLAERFAATMKGRATIVVEIPFPESTTTFIAAAREIAAARPDAVFVPSTAGQLELIAAQLVASRVTRLSPGRDAAAKGGLLLATAEGASRRLLTRAGRYLQGAVLAPAFYAALDAPLTAGFVEAYRSAHGDEPATIDALAWDAVRAVRGQLSRLDATAGRSGLLRLLRAGRDPGLTGPLGFSASGERAGAPQLYVVDGDAIRPLPPVQSPSPRSSSGSTVSRSMQSRQ